MSKYDHTELHMAVGKVNTDQVPVFSKPLFTNSNFICNVSKGDELMIDLSYNKDLDIYKVSTAYGLEGYIRRAFVDR